jgi:tRNA(Ile)-lysidine synthase
MLRFLQCEGGSRNAALLGDKVVIRSRRGGERIQLAMNRPRQALKSLLQRAGVPVWTRRGLPLVFCGDALACVPGIGVDHRFVAPPGEIGYEVVWDES